METIIYQGQEIQATRVNYISGTFTTSTVDHDGDEDLFRDEAGRYYLRRQLIRLDSEGECREASGRTYVHRVGINAALLWATTRLNSETLDLRRDAAAMLMENRGYDDPDTTRARYIRSIFERQELVEPPATSGTRHFANGSMAVTLYLKPPVANLLREYSGSGTPVEQFYDALEYSFTGPLEVKLEDQQRWERIFKENAPDEEEADTPDTHGVSQSTLEAAAHYAAKHGRTVDQFIVDCLNLAANDDPVAPAGGGEAKTPGTVLPASAGPVEPVVEEPQPGVRRFTFDYSASRWLAARRRTVELTGEQMERARELAEAFNMDLLPFLQGLVDRNHLPGQSCRKDAKVYNLLQGEHIGFVCTDVAMARRIERAAQSRGESVEEYVAHALGGDVDTWEECMLLHPTTGDLLDTDYEELYTEVKCEYMLAPLGRENEPAAALSVRLDDEAAALVRRYLEVTAWNFTATDIVSGCVVHALGIAFENQKEAEETSGLANPQEHDGAWGYVETRINDAACRRTGSEGTELKNPDDERTTGTGRVIIELVASDLSGEELDARDREAYRREHMRRNPSDVALLAASAPEEELLPEEIHTDEPEEGKATGDGEEGR